jgi:antitoxin (DNA-binding transcriptional repressor) of toxin-antitoxin stability system
MTKVVSIYEAKTNLSKLVKKAQAGETIYIGAYGHPQAVIAPVPAKKPIKIGVWAHKKKNSAYNPKDLIGSDPDINVDFDKSLGQPLL